MGDGQRLKAILKEKGTNVRQVAKKAEVSPTTLYTIIQKDTDIKLDLGLRLATALGVPLSKISSAKAAQGVEILNQEKISINARDILDLSNDMVRRCFLGFASYSAAILKAMLDIYEKYYYIDGLTASDMRDEIKENEARLIKKWKRLCRKGKCDDLFEKTCGSAVKVWKDRSDLERSG